MGARKHAEMIKLWGDNEDAAVWRKNADGWYYDAYPRWLDDREYRVILPAYKEAWKAYLHGELQTLLLPCEWKCWNKPFAPLFINPPHEYRRKPRFCTLQDCGKWVSFSNDYPKVDRTGLLHGVLDIEEDVQKFLDCQGKFWQYAWLSGEE